MGPDKQVVRNDKGEIVTVYLSGLEGRLGEKLDEVTEVSLRYPGVDPFEYAARLREYKKRAHLEAE